MAIASLVFEQADHAAMLSLAIQAQRIVAHLDNPELAVGPPVKGDRVLDERLGGGEFDPEACLDLD